MPCKTKCNNQSVVLQALRFLWTGLFILLLTACSGGSGSDSEERAAITNASAVDMNIATALYYDQRTPEGFYKEAYQGDQFYLANHVKNIDLLPLADRQGVTVFELTSDDFIEAMDWSEQSATLQSTYKQMVANSETLLYHQFTRVDPATPQFVHLNRVLKASVLDRNGVTDTYRGRITLASMNADDVKLIIEYLWTFTINNNYGTAVISSAINETVNDFEYVMQQARLNSHFDGSCDTIDIYDVRYTVSKASGFILKNETLQREISAKRTGNFLEICGA